MTQSHWDHCVSCFFFFPHAHMTTYYDFVLSLLPSFTIKIMFGVYSIKLFSLVCLYKSLFLVILRTVFCCPTAAQLKRKSSTDCIRLPLGPRGRFSLPAPAPTQGIQVLGLHSGMITSAQDCGQQMVHMTWCSGGSTFQDRGLLSASHCPTRSFLKKVVLSRQPSTPTSVVPLLPSPLIHNTKQTLGTGM